MMTLLDLNKDDKAEIMGFSGGKGVYYRLRQMGFHIGELVAVKEKAIWGGPIVVQINGGEFAIGRGIAGKISGWVNIKKERQTVNSSEHPELGVEYQTEIEKNRHETVVQIRKQRNN